MSRPQKIIPPINGTFSEILSSVAMGSGRGKRAAIELRARKVGKNIVIKATDYPPKKP
jgi:hypothetical protein